MYMIIHDISDLNVDIMWLEEYIMVKHNLLMPACNLHFHEKDRNYILRGSNNLLRVSYLE